jgi:hypothetical protein
MTTTALDRYDAARKALAEAVRVDDVKEIRDYAVAAAAYARQAKDVDMLNNAIEIRERAERRAGEILIEMRERGERDTGAGGDRRSQLQAATVKLADLGIDKTQSSRWQAKARLSDDEFEQHVDRVKRNAVAAATDPTIEIDPGRAILMGRRPIRLVTSRDHTQLRRRSGCRDRRLTTSHFATIPIAGWAQSRR